MEYYGSDFYFCYNWVGLILYCLDFEYIKLFVVVSKEVMGVINYFLGDINVRVFES